MVGDVTEAGFQTWKDGPVEVMNRVARRWPEGFEPGLGDVCWLNLTKAGLLRGLEVERRRAAKPMEAAHAV